MNDFDLGPALHDRVGDVHPDLDRLAAASLRAGTRIRRRRTVGVSLAAAAGVAVVAGVAWPLTPGEPQAVDIGFAGQPSTPATTTATPTGTCLFGDTEGSFVRGSLTRMPQETAVGDRLSTSDSLVVQPGEVYQCEPLITTPPATPQDLPVSHDDLPGWTFGTPGDDKFPATKGGYHLSVNVRSLSDWDAWNSGDPDHPSNQIVHKGDNYFVTLQPAPDVPQSVIDELLAGLHFDSVWDEQVPPDTH